MLYKLRFPLLSTSLQAFLFLTFLEIKPGFEVTPADIITHCKQHLAGFKVPKAIVFGELPKTSTGKIQKFELRKQAGSAKAIDV